MTEVGGERRRSLRVDGARLWRRLEALGEISQSLSASKVEIAGVSTQRHGKGRYEIELDLRIPAGVEHQAIVGLCFGAVAEALHTGRQLGGLGLVMRGHPQHGLQARQTFQQVQRLGRGRGASRFLSLVETVPWRYDRRYHFPSSNSLTCPFWRVQSTQLRNSPRPPDVPPARWARW